VAVDESGRTLETRLRSLRIAAGSDHGVRMGILRGGDMYDRSAVCPFLDRSTIARGVQRGLRAEFHQLGGLRGRPDRMVEVLTTLKYSHFDARWRASQRWVDSRMCS